MKTCLLLFFFGGLLAAQDSSLGGDVVSQDGQPIASARVELRTYASTSDILRTTTDAGGHFRFTGLQAGSYSLFVYRVGFLSAQGRSITVRAGETVAPVMVTLTPQGVISGKVTDAGGWPAADAHVQALRYESREGQRELRQVGWVRANDLGEYRLARLPAGQFYVRAHPDGKLRGWDERNVPAFYPTAYDISEAKLVTVEAGKETAETDIRLTRIEGVRISGQIAGPSGTAIALPGDTYVSLASGNPRTAGYFSFRSAQIARDGTFMIRHVPPGTYTLQAGVDTSSSYSTVAEPGLTARQTVIVSDRDIAGIELRMRPVSFDVAGKVTFEGKAERAAMTILLNGTNARQFSARTNDDGTFVIKGVVVGSYQVLPSNAAPTENAAYVKSIRFGGSEVPRYLDLEGPSAGQLEVIMSTARASVEGVVSDAMGRPVQEAWVAFVGKKRSLAQADQSGRFSARVAPGDYIVIAMRDPAVLSSIEDPELLNAREKNLLRVKVVESGNPSLRLVLTVP